MLHAKFRGNRPAGSREEDFWRVFTIYGRGGHLGHVTQMPATNFRSPYPRRLHIKFGFDQPSAFREEDLLKLWTTDDGRTDAGPWVYYKLAMSLRLRWAKKSGFLKSRLKYTSWSKRVMSIFTKRDRPAMKPRYGFAYQGLDNVNLQMYTKFEPNIPRCFKSILP